MSRLFRSALIPLLAIVAVVWLASNTLMSKPSHASSTITTYSQLIDAVKSGNPKIAKVEFNPSKRSITATESNNTTTITVHYPTDQSATQFEDLLQTKNIQFDS